MLKKYSFNLAIYVCIDHNDSILEKYFDNLNDIFNTISQNNSDSQLIKLLNPIVLADLKKGILYNLLDNFKKFINFKNNFLNP